MPIYEYVCDACGHQMEALQKISDDPLKLCPECDQEALRKKISAAAFRLKGGGWYETDFKSGNKKNLAGDADKPDNKSSDGKDGKKDVKTGEGGKAGKSENKSQSESSSKKKDATKSG